jgi:hypothetical protein
MKNQLRTSIQVCFIVLSFLLSVCYAQHGFKTLRADGRVISEGRNTTPVGTLKAATYRLEMVRLERPFAMGRDEPPLDEVFRLKVKTSEPLPMEVFAIWINEVEYPAVQVEPKAVAVLLYRRTLDSGMTLGLSIQGKIEIADRSVLPETLYVPPEYVTPSDELEARQPRVKLTRLSHSRASGGAMVKLEIENAGFGLGSCENTNSGCDYFIEMDGRRLGIDNTFSLQEFAQLRDGAEIVVKRGRHLGRPLREPATVRTLGRLEKSRLRMP